MKKQAFVLGFGWFALQAIWTAYNAYMPLLYKQLVGNLAVVGFLMTLDNILALSLQPWWGARSDRTRSPIGRRLPYLMVGMPLAALFAGALPFFANNLPLLIGVALLMNLAMTSWRPSLVSLFSDLFPKNVRTQVSGFTDVFAGIGAIVVLLVGGRLFEVSPAYPFIMVAAFLVLAAVILRLGIKEPHPEALGPPDASDLPPRVIPAIQTLVRLPNRSPLFFLCAMFFAYSAWNAIESFWTTYATSALRMPVGAASDYAAILALSYLVGAFPSGYIASRLGRQRTILLGIGLLIPLYIACALNRNITLFAVLLGLLGASWSLVLVNGVILFQEFASLRQIGLFTGIFSVGTALAQIAGPPTYGFLMQQFGNQALWVTALVSLVLCAFFVALVREGRVGEETGRPGDEETRSVVIG